MDDFRRKVEARQAELLERQNRIMAGIKGRSGRPSSAKSTTQPDGLPQPPRKLTAAAQKQFDWLLERLGTTDDSTPWRRIDGVSLASLAELLEAEERLAEKLASDPFNERLLRLKMQHADRVFKFSGIVGLTPRDRERLPQNSKAGPDDADEWENECD
jgi:phage terminase small subunit